MGQRNHKGNQKIVKRIKIKAQHIKTWDTVEVVQRGKFIVKYAYIKSKKDIEDLQSRWCSSPPMSTTKLQLLITNYRTTIIKNNLKAS